MVPLVVEKIYFLWNLPKGNGVESGRSTSSLSDWSKWSGTASVLFIECSSEMSLFFVSSFFLSLGFNDRSLESSFFCVLRGR
jgi:hypothetical protein